MEALPRYRGGDVPEHLKTLAQLRELGQRPPDPEQPDGVLEVALFDSRVAVTWEPVPSLARRGRERLHESQWAANVLEDPNAVVLDVECTDLHGRIIEIAVVAVTGEVLLDTLIDPDGEPIAPAAAEVHGITEDVLSAQVLPRFGDLIDELRDLLSGKRIVGWNVSYDRNCLTAEANRLLPHYSTAGQIAWVQAQWEDAMLHHAAWVGEWDDQRGDWRRHPLHGGHRALADCVAVIQQLQEMAVNPDPQPVTSSQASPEETSNGRKVRGWSDEEDSALHQFTTAGVAADEMARSLGRSEKAVKFRLHKLGLGPFPMDELPSPGQRKPKPPPAYTFAELRKVHPNSHKRWTEEEEQRLAARHNDGASIAELVQEFGRNEGAIRSRLGVYQPPTPEPPPF